MTLAYDNLREPEPGKPVSAKWGRDVVRAIKALTPCSGKNMSLKRTSYGTTFISNDGQGRGNTYNFEAGAPVPCRITGGSAVAGYNVDIFANGIGVDRTGIGTLMAMQFNTNTSLPVGTIVMAYTTDALIIGGTEQE